VPQHQHITVTGQVSGDSVFLNYKEKPRRMAPRARRVGLSR
jgi:hypothetical protein